jgi:Tol biopolymer transport system component
MSLTAGTRLGPYEIQSALGAGGMGEVYRARDTRLNRDVAIKVLPAGLAEPERLSRFEQEARAAAALNHPNILAVFDFGAHDGAPFIVTELLEGQTLRARIDGGALPVRKAIGVGVEIARGLAAAHEKGIVHRDLKPDNVFVTADERVKILDFGLAKLTQPAAAGSMMATGIPDTVSGVVMGTVGYMAPEQVRGANADHRADIFALGAVLYEMLTGIRAFQRETPAETMTAILRDDPPPLTAATRPVPPALDRIVRRCLEKNPAARFQSALDLAFALDALETATGTGASMPAEALAGRGAREGRWPQLAIWLGAMLALAGLAATGTAMFLRRVPEAPPVTFSAAPPAGWAIDTGGQTPTYLAVSPDGQSLAFAARDSERRTQIWIRSLATLEARPLAGTADGRGLFWSPDGRWLGFFTARALMKVDVTGGLPVTVAEVANGSSGTWNGDDVILFAVFQPLLGPTAPGTSGLLRVPAAGGIPSPATTLGPDERGHSRPHFLPDGRRFLFTAGKQMPSPAASRVVFVGSLDSMERTRLFETDSLVVSYSGGHLLFLNGSTLVAQPFDAARLAMTGEPIPIAERVGIAGVTNNRYGVYAASGTGTLAYQSGAALGVHQLAWFDRSGRQTDPVGEAASHQSIELLPDGLRAPLSVVDQARGTRDIWMFDTARGLRTRFTFDPAEERSAVPSPDGQRIVFNSQRTGAFELYVKASSGAGAEELIFKDGRSKDPMDWSSDGRFIVYRVTGEANTNDIYVLDLVDEGRTRPIVATSFDENYGRLSPDGRWMAYTSNESGQVEVYVTPFPSGEGKWQVSRSGGDFARWRGDGRELFYIGQDRMLTAVAVDGRGAGFDVGAATPLFAVNVPAIPGYPYAVTARGDRFLINTNVTPPTPLTVILNWTATLPTTR